MQEELKTALILLISPFLFSILIFILKKLFTKYEKQQNEILKSLSKLSTNLLTLNQDIKTVSSNLTRLESSYLSQSKFIDKEITLRNSRFDRLSDKIMGLDREIAIINEKIKVFT